LLISLQPKELFAMMEDYPAPQNDKRFRGPWLATQRAINLYPYVRVAKKE
jgi:hypothetical protein